MIKLLSPLEYTKLIEESDNNEDFESNIRLREIAEILTKYKNVNIETFFEYLKSNNRILSEKEFVEITSRFNKILQLEQLRLLYEV